MSLLTRAVTQLLIRDRRFEGKALSGKIDSTDLIVWGL